MKKMSLYTILRLGLRNFTVGLHAVLAVGVLNRIMKVEMGLDMTLVSTVICAFYFVAPVAVPLGHRSDTRPYFGYHRLPYIVVGTIVTAITTALAPFVALFMAEQNTWLSVAVGVGLFLVMGMGLYMATTAYVSLIADRTVQEERSKVTSLVWAMMMFGIVAGALLSKSFLDVYTSDNLVQLFLISTGIFLVLTFVSIWGMEKPGTTPRPSDAAVTWRQAAKVMTGLRQARLFFALTFSIIFFLFLQQVVLEPFGGDVFGMSPSETTMFNIYQVVGTLVGMLASGWLIRQIGLRQTLALGALIAMAAYGWLALTAMMKQPAWLPPAIVVMGLGMGG